MSYSIIELEEFMNRLERVISRVKDKSIEWWWLDQGEAPVYAPFKLRVSGDKVEYERMPKVSLVVALRVLKDNLKDVVSVDEVRRVSIINDIARELYELYNIINIIVDADGVVKEIEKLINLAKSKGIGEEDNLYKRLIGLVDKVRDTIKTKPEEWSSIKEGILKEMEDISSKLTAFEREKVIVKEHPPIESEEKEAEELIDELNRDVDEVSGEMEGA